MSIALILSLLDEEIARLEEARTILAAYVEPRLGPVSPSPISEVATPAGVGASPITVLPPRVRRSRSARSNQLTEMPDALHALVPVGAVAVSATEAARKRMRVAPVADPTPLRWTPARAARTPTIDELFRTSDPLAMPADEALRDAGKDLG